MMKKTAIMQPYFFPYIGYWQMMNAVDDFVVYDDVNYIKNGWVNRNNILLNSQKHLVTVPLSGASPFLLINQIKVCQDKKREKLLKTIEQAYKKAPFFSEIFPIVFNTVMYPSEFIVDALYFSIKEISSFLEMKTNLILSSTLAKKNELKGKDKVINVCQLLNTDVYINAIGGLKLYDKNDFKQNNIDLYFIKTNDISYPQFGKEFVSGLSIIDVLMFNSKLDVQKLLSEYTLI